MPEDAEILDPDDGPAVATEYVKQFRDRWAEIRKTAVVDGVAPRQIGGEISLLVNDLLDSLEMWRGDHYTVSAQCLHVTDWLAKKAGMNAEPWKPKE